MPRLKKRSGMLKGVLLTISLSLFACNELPSYPEVWQCAYAGDPRAFYCINTVTKEQKKIDALDDSMRAAQCLSPSDYVKSEAWVSSIKDIARQRCR